jgi:photosystem II stability/assembly factor-like uncharacterized protein
MTKRFFFVLVFLLFSTSLFAQTGWYKLSTTKELRVSSADWSFFSSDSLFLFNRLDSIGSHAAFTSDGGVTWVDKLKPLSIVFPDSPISVRYDLGFNFKDFNIGIIGRTTDRGKSWANYSYDTSQMSPYGISFLTPEIGFIYGSYGWNPYKQAIMKTSDSGKTWLIIHQDEKGEIFSIKFRDEMNGLLLHKYTNDVVIGSEIWYTDNGGYTWTLLKTTGSQTIIYLPGFRRWLLPTRTGVDILDQDSLVLSNHSAFKFDSKNEAHTFCNFSFYGDYIGYGITSDGDIYKTTDGGINWREQQVPNGFIISNRFMNCNIYAASSLIAYAYNDSVIIKTIDGGGPAASVILTKEKDYALIPNPSTDHLTITLEASLVAETLEVYNSLGAKVLVSEIPANSISYQLDISHLASGIYLAKAGSRIMRFVKE